MKLVATAIVVVLSLVIAACGGGGATVDADPNLTAGELAVELGAIAEARNTEMQGYTLNESAAAMRELSEVVRTYADAMAAAATGDLTTAEVATLVDGTRLYAEANDLMAEALETGDMNLEEGVAMFMEAQSVVSPWWGAPAEEPSTTSEPATAATTEPSTATTAPTPDAAAVPGQAWIEAMADNRFHDAVDLSTGAPQRMAYYQQVSQALDPEGFDYSVQGTEVTEGGVTWRFAEGDSTTYDNPVVDDDGLVIDFDRNGISILKFAAPAVGPVATEGEVAAQVMTVFHRQSSEGVWVTTVVIEVDNASAEDLNGSWDALLVGSDGHSATAEGYDAFEYPAKAVTDDVLVFTGVEDLSGGGELRLSIDYDTTLVVEVPRVPESE